ncbi:CODM [Symbiodinium pilosum]|uniref:CODM protein n=1 Tax=Symbiodinium pilosum TaxID=2952 RepID=A0A812LT69_SYMPI|nr:CODM [Symbiodinium pilosum]
MTASQGRFTSNIADLLSPASCDISNACNASALVKALNYVDINIYADDGKRTGTCVRYEIPGVQNSSSTGGPCFTAFATYTIRKKGDPTKTRKIRGSISEAGKGCSSCENSGTNMQGGFQVSFPWLQPYR